MPPRSRPIGGMSRSLTKDVTIAPKAAPSTTATARSTTLPRMRNVLNSRSMPASLFLGDQEPAERQVGQPRALEGVDGVGRRADQRLAVQVERGVEHGADAGAALELADHSVVAGIPALV